MLGRVFFVIFIVVFCMGCVFDTTGISTHDTGHFDQPTNDWRIEGPITEEKSTAEPSPPRDTDGDQIPDSKDNCINTVNKQQLDIDADDVGDQCDNCPAKKNPNQDNSDGDTLGDVCDNCPKIDNQEQADQDNDGLGDLCDPDKDGDKLPNDIDPNPSVFTIPLYYKTGDHVLEDSRFLEGSFEAQRTKMCSDTEEKHFSRLIKNGFPSYSYIAETRFSSTPGTSSPPMAGSSPPMAGIVTRITNDNTGYFCLIDLATYRLVLAKRNESGWEELKSTAPNTVPSGTSSYRYRIRGLVKYRSISCQLMDTSVNVISVDNYDHYSGTAGVISYFTQTTCFDYLLIL